MSDMFTSSVYFGVLLSLFSYETGLFLKKKLKWSIWNPLLISIIITIMVLVLFRIDYESYYSGARYLSYLLTPATVCLAVPLYEKIELLKHHWKAIIYGIASGVVASLVSIFAMACLFRFSHEEYVTMLPKSITTAIGIGISEELGGFVAITVAVIIITGVLGNMFAEIVFRLFRITEPIAKGVALGTASHAMGTARAMEIGTIEGAMSSLSIVVAGIITVVGASVFAVFL